MLRPWFRVPAAGSKPPAPQPAPTADGHAARGQGLGSRAKAVSDTAGSGGGAARSAADSGVADSGVADSGGADSGVADSGVAGSGGVPGNGSAEGRAGDAGAARRTASGGVASSGGMGGGEAGSDPEGRGRLRLLGADTALAAAILAVFSVASGPVGKGFTGSGASVAWILGVMAAAVLPVALRRVAPFASVLLVCAVILLTEASGSGLGPAVDQGLAADAALGAAAGRGIATVAALIVVYTRAALGPLREAVLGALIVSICGTAVGASEAGPAGPRVAGVTAGLLALLACFFLGRTVFTRRAYTAALEERARTAELNREAAARQAVFDERRRIARELHDMVAHHVSVMGVLATGARRTLRRDPDAADEALRTIEETGRASLREMRRLLDVLRSDDDHAPEEPPPEPGVAGLERLVDQVREAGLTVSLSVEGRPVSLEPGVDLTVFRLVQEALTNVLKHAGATTALVALSFAADTVRVSVTDDGHGRVPGPPTAGHGLVGMRERVALYGGTLQTGARTGGGFRVLAQLPLDAIGPVRAPWRVNTADPWGDETGPAGVAGVAASADHGPPPERPANSAGPLADAPQPTHGGAQDGVIIKSNKENS